MARKKAPLGLSMGPEHFEIRNHYTWSLTSDFLLYALCLFSLLASFAGFIQQAAHRQDLSTSSGRVAQDKLAACNLSFTM
jgi:hypothetical protein